MAESLLRTKQLAQLDGGLRIEQRMESYNVRFDELSSQSDRFALVSRKAWLDHVSGGGSQTTVQWCDAKRRGIVFNGFLLGRQRASTPDDLARPPLGLSGNVMTSLERTYQGYDVKLEPQSENRTVLVLPHPTNRDHEVRITIDTQRHVILANESRLKGKVTSSTKYGDFVKVAGAWWATRIETFDAEGRLASRATQKFTPLAAEVFQQQIDKQLAVLKRVQLIHDPLPKVVEAKQAAAGGKATFDDQLVLMLHFAQTQQWDRVMEHLTAADELAAGKPGIRWLRYAVLNNSRRREELRTQLMKEVKRIAAAKTADDYFLAEYVRAHASGVFQANEMLALLETLKPVYERRPKHYRPMVHWTQQRINYLQQTGQADEAFRLRKQLAADYPRNYNVQLQYASALVNRGDYAAAYAHLDRVLADESAKWLPHEAESFRSTYTQYLRNEGRYPELADYLAAWIEKNPETTSAYSQYLTALVRTDRSEKADELKTRWLAEGQKPDELSPGAAARLNAAVQHMLGHGYNLYTNRLDEKWLKPLADAVIFFAQHKTHSSVADQIMGNSNFTRSDECREVRKTIARKLIDQIDSLPVDRLQRFVSWIWPNDPAVETRTWRRIAEGIERRWSAEADPVKKHQLASPNTVEIDISHSHLLPYGPLFCKR